MSQPPEDPLAAAATANHRIGNSLALVASLARMRASRLARAGLGLTAEEAAQSLEDIAAQVHGVGLLHQMLSYLPEQATIDLRDYLQRLCDMLQSCFPTAGRIVLSPSAGAACTVSPDDARPIGLMVLELVTNALKHAHPDGGPGRVTVGCRREEGGGLAIEVADDGRGLPAGLDPTMAGSGKLGFQLLRSMARAMKATLRFDSSAAGLRVRVTLPQA